MAKAKKQERLRRQPRDLSFNELRNIAERHGFILRSVNGSHYQFRHGALPEIVSIPARLPVKPFYIKLVVTLIDRLDEEA